MKKTIKLIKNNILGFIIGIILTSIVSVSAVTYLYSSDQVSYSNSNSSVTDVNGALDELYDLSALTDGEYQLDVSMIVTYQSSGSATTRFSPLCNFKVENGNVTITSFNDTAQYVTIIGKTIYVDPSNLTITKIN